MVETAEPATTESNPAVNGATSAIVADVPNSIDAYNDSLNQNTPSAEINYLNSPQSSQARSDNSQPSQLATNSHQQPAPGIASEFNNRDRKSVWPWMVALVAICVVFAASLVLLLEAQNSGEKLGQSAAETGDTGSLSVESITTIPTLAGDKLSLAVSSDGEQIAYSVEPSGSEVFQLYVQNLASGELKLLSEKDIGHVRDMSFVLDNRAIAFTAQKNNRTDLLVTRLDRDSKELAHPIKTGYYDSGNIAVDPTTNKLFLPAFGGPNVAIIQEIDINTGSAREASFSDTPGVFDYLVALSPRGTKYSYVRYNRANSSFTIYIFDRATDELLNRINWSTGILSLNWLDEQRLLILDGRFLYALDVVNNSTQKLMSNEFQQLYSLKVVNSDSLFVLKKQRPESNEVRLSVNGLKPLTKIPLPKNTVSSAPHFESNKRFLVIRKPIGFSFNEYDVSSGHVQALLESQIPIEVLDHDVEKRAILLRVRGRVAVYYLATNEIQYISNRTQVLGSASFSCTKQAILFSEKHISGWRIRTYNIDSGRLTDLVSGYRAIACHENGHSYLVEDSNGKILWVDKNFETIKDTGIVTDDRFTYQDKWGYISGNLVWKDLHDKEVFLHMQNLKSGERVTFKSNIKLINTAVYPAFKDAVYYVADRGEPQTHLLKITLKRATDL